MSELTLTADEIARRSAEAMWENDVASQSLGMTIESVAAGTATIRMPVMDKMVNGQGNCHGGYIFTLADSAFAFACNSYNQQAVAHHGNITFITSAHAGDVLVAVATERSRSGRNGIYDVAVMLEDGTQVAEMRGFSRTISGTHIELKD